MADTYDFWQELQETWDVSAVNLQEKVYLPSNFDKPFRFFDFTNNNKMIWTTREEYITSNISSVSGATTGQPRWSMLYGVSAVARSISSGITLKVKSSNVSDNTGIIVRIEGWLDSAKTILGYENITVSTSTPTTYATATSPSTFYGITRITKSADTIGFITIADNSSNILGTIPPVDRETRYPVLYLGPIANATISYQMLYKRKVKKLVDDNDYPFTDCEDYLTMYAAGYAFNQEKESETRAKMMWDKASDNLKTLLVNAQGRMGPDFQQGFVPATAQAHRS